VNFESYQELIVLARVWWWVGGHKEWCVICGTDSRSPMVKGKFWEKWWSGSVMYMENVA